MSKDTITIRFEIHEGDVTPQFLWPTPHIGIMEVLDVDFVGGQWEVTNPEAAPSWQWIGRAEWRIGAILDYLRARLGMPKQSEEENIAS